MTNERRKSKMFYLVEYIKDCKRYMKLFPYHNEDGKGNKRIYVRNVLYCNAQPKYLLGRIITKALR